MAAESLNTKNFRDIVKELKYSFETTANRISGEVQSTFSNEMADVVELGRSAFEKVTSFSSFIFQSLFKKKKVDQSIINQGKVLDSMYKMQKQEHLAKQGFLKKQGSFWDWILVPLVAAAALLGGFIRKLILPFELLWKSLAPLKVLTKLPLISNLIEWTKSAFLWIAELTKIKPLFSKISGWMKIFGEVLRDMPILGKLFRALRWGFGKLGIYLQIVMSAFDFIEGFMDTQGDILDKIKGGVKNVIFRFFEFPVMLMGYLWNWIDKTLLGGTSSYQETADKFVAAWKTGLDAVFSFFSFETIERAWTGLKDVWLSFKDSMVKLWDDVIVKTKAFFGFLLDIPMQFNQFIQEKKTALTDWWNNTWLGSKFNVMKDQDLREYKENRDLDRGSVLDSVEEKMQLDRSNQTFEDILSTLKKLLVVNEEQLKSQDTTSMAIANSTTINNQQNGPQLRDIPTQSNSKGINLYNGEFVYGR